MFGLMRFSQSSLSLDWLRSAPAYNSPPAMLSFILNDCDRETEE